MRWMSLVTLLACTADPKGSDPADSAPETTEPSAHAPDPLKDRDGDGAFTGQDCDDYDAAIHPGATEICDHLDNDCDGVRNDGVYVDQDDDSWGVPIDGQDCEPGTNTAEARDDDDCDDTDPNVSPSHGEVCDGIDNDCDGDVDDGYYLDADGDGDGAPGPVDCSIEGPAVQNDDDCDDTDAEVHEGATEVCDGLDNDCDGDVDERFYADLDGDGYGDVDVPCVPGGTNASRTGDCDDADASISPRATEICDGVDQDCDGTADDGYTDADGDGSGDPVAACATGQALVSTGDDCDDADDTVYPRAEERCDGLDNDCDITVDELPSFQDLDGDGWGGALRGSDCSAGVAYLDQGGDCDDTDASVYPGADEVCDGVDNDCDGEGDEELAWTDADGDGYGETERTGDCDPTVTYASVGDDCDDADSSAHPYACDDCDGLDNDCDGGIDEAGADGKTVGYIDRDKDGYGDDARASYGCHKADEWSLEGGDCDDGAVTVNPDMAEICQDGVDNDCDGLLDCEDDDCGEEDCSETDCGDGVDGDQDGYLDCQDDDCWGADCGYAVAVVTGGQLGGAVVQRSRRDSTGNRRSTTEMAFSGSVTGRLVAHSAAGVAIATCDWRVGHVALRATARERERYTWESFSCGTYGYTSWKGSCADWYHFDDWGCGSGYVAETTSKSSAALARESVSVASGCGVTGDDFLPRALVLVEGKGWQTAGGAPWYAGVWSTTASRSAGFSTRKSSDRTESDDVQLLLSEASSFTGPLDP